MPVRAFTLPPLFCGFEVQVTPVVDREFGKILKASDGSMTFLVTGAATPSFTNLQTGKTHHRERVRAGEDYRAA